MAKKQTVLGKVCITPKESGLTAYSILDLIVVEGRAYLSLKNDNSASVSDETSWMKTTENTYDIAVRHGFEGTEEEWLTSLSSASESAAEIAKKAIEDCEAATKAAGDAKEKAHEAATRLNTLSDHMPKIDGGTWWFWNEETGEYVDSKIVAKGKDFTIKGYFTTPLELEAVVTDPVEGDAYGVGEEAPYDIYVYDSINDQWVNNGKLQGPAGRSAYEIAVDAGFEGTEEEWLELLQPDLDQLALKEELLPIREELEDLTGRFNHTTEEVTQRMETIEEEYATKEEVQEKIDLFGRVFRLRGTVESEEELTFIEEPADGDVVLVKIDSTDESNKFKGYVYIAEEEKWELIGSTSLDDIYTKEEIDEKVGECAKISETRNFSTTQSLSAGTTIVAGGNVFSGGKTASNPTDGKAGVSCVNNGNIVMVSDGNPYIFFYRNLEAANDAYIGNYDKNKLTYGAVNGHDFNGIVNANSGISWKGIAISAGADLNHYTTEGIYRCTSNAIAATVKNSPVSVAFNLIVLSSLTDNSYVTQILFAFSTGNNGRIYKRTYSNNITSDWEVLPFAKETPQFGTFTTINSFSSNHNLDNYQYDIRHTYTGGGATDQLGTLSGGIDGGEYIFSYINNGSGTVTLTFPSNIQSNAASMTVEAGNIGEIFIRRIGTKYIIRV